MSEIEMGQSRCRSATYVPECDMKRHFGVCVCKHQVQHLRSCVPVVSCQTEMESALISKPFVNTAPFAVLFLASN